jgi:hypothetical protein
MPKASAARYTGLGRASAKLFRSHPKILEWFILADIILINNDDMTK